jgi:4-amino-4-deoxy-L-arabinose transferase-like glycosyltransferase
MQVWDEIRLANNTIEMVDTGNLLVTRYDGKPEVWNTKPPLQIWLEALSVKVLGIQSLAFRLPSALAALATVLLLFRFARRQLDDLWAAT